MATSNSRRKPSAVIRELRERRIARGLSIPDVAAKMDIKPARLACWERGETRPNPSFLPTWRAALRVEKPRKPWVPATPPHENLVAAIDTLKARRKSLGLSQIELDERIGWALGLTGKYEAMIRRPTTQSLAEWAQALELRIVLAPPGSVQTG